jgi:hypothetical protein
MHCANDSEPMIHQLGISLFAAARHGNREAVAGLLLLLLVRGCVRRHQPASQPGNQAAFPPQAPGAEIPRASAFRPQPLATSERSIALGASWAAWERSRSVCRAVPASSSSTYCIKLPPRPSLEEGHPLNPSIHPFVRKQARVPAAISAAPAERTTPAKGQGRREEYTWATAP